MSLPSSGSKEISAKILLSKSLFNFSEHINFCVMDEHPNDTAQSDECEYIVRPGDTLRSIAVKFEFPVSWLSMINDNKTLLVVNDHLKIRPRPPDMPIWDPVDARLYHPFDEQADVDGKLTLTQTSLVFTPKEGRASTTVISLLGCMEAGIMPHPKLVEEHPERVLEPNAPHILIVSYLKNPYDKTKMEMVNFIGERRDFTCIQSLLNTLSARAKEHEDYEAPNPNALPVVSVRTVLTDTPGGPMLVRRRAMVAGTLCAISYVGGKSNILTNEQIEKIRQSVPRRYLNSNWHLLFQLSRDGKSYMTFYDKTERKEPIVLILRTASNECIGAYASRDLKRSKNYYGTGETFVFHFSPQYEAFHWKPQNKNQYFVTSTADEISFGGGGACAIWMDGEFLRGMSEPCTTYESPGLCAERDFGVVEVEVWHLA